MGEEWKSLLVKKTDSEVLRKPVEDSVVKKKTIDDRIADGVNGHEEMWRILGGGDYYNMGRMLGACNGPDMVSLKDVMDRFAMMMVEMVKDTYYKVDKTPPKEILDIYTLASKAVSSLDTTELPVNRLKILGALQGFADNYIKCADPEAVKNMMADTL